MSMTIQHHTLEKPDSKRSMGMWKPRNALILTTVSEWDDPLLKGMLTVFGQHVPTVLYAAGPAATEAKVGTVLRTLINGLCPTVVVALGPVMAGHVVPTRPLNMEQLRSSNPSDHQSMSPKVVVTWGPEDFVGPETDKRKKQAWKDLLLAKTLL